MTTRKRFLEQMLKDAKDGKLGEQATFDDFKREYFRRSARPMCA